MHNFQKELFSTHLCLVLIFHTWNFTSGQSMALSNYIVMDKSTNKISNIMLIFVYEFYPHFSFSMLTEYIVLYQFMYIGLGHKTCLI